VDLAAAVIRAGGRLGRWPDRLLDAERGIAHFPVQTLTPDSDAALVVALVPAVPEQHDVPARGAQTLRRRLVADAEQVQLVGASRDDARRRPHQGDPDPRRQRCAGWPLAARPHDEHHESIVTILLTMSTSPLLQEAHD